MGSGRGGNRQLRRFELFIRSLALLRTEQTELVFCQCFFGPNSFVDTSLIYIYIYYMYNTATRRAYGECKYYCTVMYILWYKYIVSMCACLTCLHHFLIWLAETLSLSGQIFGESGNTQSLHTLLTSKDIHKNYLLTCKYVILSI